MIRLSPQAENVVWVGGAATTSRQGKVARAASAFARQQGDQIAFRVEIENMSPAPILVDPARFYYRTCALRGTPRTRTCNPSHYVTNPEQVLLDLDVQNSRAKAESANTEAFWTTMLLLNATAAVAGVASGRHQIPTNVLVGAHMSATALDATASEDAHQASAYEIERANWAAAALRKTTLPPGKHVAGLVFIPRDESANEVSLQLRVGDDVLAFPFDQTVHRIRIAPVRDPQRSASGMNL